VEGSVEEKGDAATDADAVGEAEDDDGSVDPDLGLLVR